jgi:hypothetical protein
VKNPSGGVRGGVRLQAKGPATKILSAPSRILGSAIID